MNTNQLSWAPPPSKALSQGTLPVTSLKRAKSAFLKSGVASLLRILLIALRILELHHFMVTAANAALQILIPHQILLGVENRVQQSTSPRWLLYHLEKKAIINTFQEPPRMLMPCCVVPPTDIGLVEVLSGNQGLLTRGHSYLSIEGLIPLVFLVRRPVAAPSLQCYLSLPSL